MLIRLPSIFRWCARVFSPPPPPLSSFLCLLSPLSSFSQKVAACAAGVAALEAQGGKARAEAELQDSQLRGLGHGHRGSRLASSGHGEDTLLRHGAAPTTAGAGTGAGASAAGYSFVDDLAGRWMSEAARLKSLRQRRCELLGGGS